MTSDGMLIGELAERTGVSARSLRYYEQHGLLTSDRDHNGYRRYREDVVHLVRNLRLLLGGGLSIADVKQFGSCVFERDLGARPCTAALGVYEHRLRAIDERIAALTGLHDTLAAQADQLRRHLNSGMIELP